VSDLGVAHSEWISGLTLVWLATAAVVALARLRAARRWARLFGAPRPPASRGDALLIGALLSIVVALAGPQLGERLVRIPATGVDVVVLLDVSRSMDARDTPPSRLARARETARRVLLSLPAGDRAALAAFAGHGTLLTPLTPDKGALVELLPALDSGLMSDRGSRAETGLDAALEAFDPESARPRVVLLLSDGEHGSLEDSPTLTDLRRAEVRVVTVAFGSEAGATIPESSGTLHDSLGREVVTRRVLASLRYAARATDGANFAADRWGAIPAARLRRALREEAGLAGDGWIERRVAATRVGLPAGIALSLLAFEALRPRARGSTPRRRRRPAQPRVTRAAIASLVAGASFAAATVVSLVLLIATAASADDRERLERAVRALPEEVHWLLRLGLARAESGDGLEAARAFEAAAMRARDPSLAALAYYNLGVAALDRRDMETARQAFFDAIALDPTDRRAKFNLEWTLRALPLQDAATERQGPSPLPGQARESAPEPDPPPAHESSARRDGDPTRGAASLDPGEAARWLEAVQDDPRRALRAAAREPTANSRKGGPRW